MNYKKLPKAEPDFPQIYVRIDDDGLIRRSCGDNDRQFQEWLAEGNTPEPAE